MRFIIEVLREDGSVWYATEAFERGKGPYPSWGTSWSTELSSATIYDEVTAIPEFLLRSSRVVDRYEVSLVRRSAKEEEPGVKTKSKAKVVKKPESWFDKL